MKSDAETRAICSVSKLPLFAIVDASGKVTGVTNGGDHGAPSPDPDLRGTRHLPLYGADMPFDLATEVRIGPIYSVEGDRVYRSFTVRTKTKAEKAQVAAWWHAAMHSPAQEQSR